ncbi:MAG: ISL3 family transposase [Geminicoccaceae bacterium]
MVPAVLPIPRSLHVETLLLDEERLTILASSAAADAPCPLCGQRSERVHSHYARSLADLPWADVAVHLRVHVRKFFCDNAACPRRVFAERLAGVAQACARRTDRQRGALTAIAFALGGEAGARLARQLGMPISPDTLLRLIRRDPDDVRPVPTVLGVDDWAIHKGLTYGTILVDLLRHRPVDLLPDRASGSLAGWLQTHPGVQIIARDRAGAYAEGARDGAPDATQVADRWHLIDNLADTLEATLRTKTACLKAAATTLAGQAQADSQERAPPEAIYQGKRRHPQPERWRDRVEMAAEAGVARRRANDEQVRALHAQGVSVAQIARTVGIARMTVYRYLREGPPQRKRHTVHGPQRVLEPYEPYLLQRWADGCHTATRLWREIQAQGFAYSLTTVQRFVNQLRREGPPPADRPRTALTKPQGPPPRQVAALILRRPERRTTEQRAYLKHLGATDPTIATAVDLAADFLVMLRRREGARLPTWLEAAETSGISELARFASKLREDLAAVQEGLTLRYSNGQTEGQVTRLKLVKRQGYGRATFDLLRKRVLRAA